MARVRIIRHANWTWGFRKFNILLDGLEVGTIANGKIWEGEVTPGFHTLQLAIDFNKSQCVEFEVQYGESIEFECSCEFELIEMLIPILFIVGSIKGKHFLFLKQTETTKSSPQHSSYAH